LVIVGHVLYESPWHFLALVCGYAGVSFFFVLSGYLITRNLLADERKYGVILLPRFYLRRILRIWPAFYTFLAVSTALSLAGALPPLPPGTLLFSALHLRNFQGGGWQTGHLWSLALEEQFYFVWPLLLVLFPPRFRLRLVLLTIGLFVSGRLLFLPTGIVEGIYSRPELRLDTFMIGGLIALASRHRVRCGVAAFAIVSLPIWMILAPGFARLLDTTVAAALIALALKWLVDNPQALPARLLCWRPLTAVGTISYSLYLWQQIFFGPRAAVLQDRPIALVLLPAAVYASHRFIELPGIRRGHTAALETRLPPAPSVLSQNKISPLSTVTAWPDR
jgi:peptidoglycan/LPS O-acetylase OafA/YrhL